MPSSKLPLYSKEFLFSVILCSFVLEILESSTRHHEEFRHEVPASGSKKKERGRRYCAIVLRVCSSEAVPGRLLVVVSALRERQLLNRRVFLASLSL